MDVRFYSSSHFPMPPIERFIYVLAMRLVSSTYTRQSGRQPKSCYWEQTWSALMTTYWWGGGGTIYWLTANKTSLFKELHVFVAEFFWRRNSTWVEILVRTSSSFYGCLHKTGILARIVYGLRVTINSLMNLLKYKLTALLVFICGLSASFPEAWLKLFVV